MFEINYSQLIQYEILEKLVTFIFRLKAFGIQIAFGFQAPTELYLLNMLLLQIRHGRREISGYRLLPHGQPARPGPQLEPKS